MSSSEISRKRKHGKTYTSSASESTEDSTGLPTKKPSTSASTWKIEDLDLQSIFFATEYLSMETLISLLKKRRPLEDVPKIVSTLIGFTKECLNFTIDENTWQMCDSSVRPEQEKGIEILISTKKTIRMFANKIRSEEAQLLDEEPINRDLFERWYCKVVDFIDQAVQLLNLLINEALEKIEHKKQTSLLHIKEGSFTYLFMKFTEICFLSPEPGEGAKTDLWIRNKRVGCLPDIRYWQQSSMPNRNILIMLAEVKIAAFKNSENTEESEVSKNKDTNTACTIVTVSCPNLIEILVHSPSTQTGEQQKKQNSFEGQTSDTSSNRAQNLSAASTGRRRHRWVSERGDSEPDIIAIELDADNDDDAIGVEVGTNGTEDVMSVEVDADRISFEYEVCSDEDDIISSTASVSGISDTNVVIICGDSDMEFWGDSDSSDSELSDGDKWTCTECDTKNSPLNGHCGHCKKVRPNWLPETTRKRRLEKMNSKDKALLSSSECSDISHISSKIQRRSSRDRLMSIELESDKDLIAEEEDSGISTLSRQQSSQENLAENKLKSYSSLIENSSTLGSFRTLLNFQTTASAKNKDEMTISNKIDKLDKPQKDLKLEKSSNIKEFENSQSQLGQCCICFSRPKTASIIHGCTGHQVCCYRCAKRLKRLAKPCPLCRRPIQKVIKNYFA